MDRDASVGDLGEDGLVAAVLSRLPPMPASVLVGAGDDAAVLARLDGSVVVSTDTVVQGEDFDLAWSTGRDVGVKVSAQNLADLAAMGARPVALVVSLAAPAELPASWAGELTDGLADECARGGAALVGGDVSQAPVVVVTGTALGVLPAATPAVLRSGARVGDVVALAGAVGRSAAGLDLLRSGRRRDDPDPVLARLIEDHLGPRPPYPAGEAGARAGASAMIDTSDGLVRDARRLGEASGVLLDLDAVALAPSPDLAHAAERLGDADPGIWVLSGGEDHALLATFPPDTTPPEGFRVVGRVVPAGAEGGGGVLVDHLPAPADGGWRHFRHR
jgi:thiamine-monophosphate kinase